MFEQFGNLVTSVKELILELKALRAEDSAPESEKIGVYTLLVGVLFGRNPFPPNS